MKLFRWIAPILILGLMAGGCQGSGKTPAGNQGHGQAVANQPFPDFSVKTFDNQTVLLSQYRGKIMILDLFATWCPPCRMEIPHFVALQEQYADRLAVVGLSYDQAPVKKVKAFASEMKINYDLYWGSEEIAKHVGLRGIPHTLVLDTEGRVVRSYVGYRDKIVFEKDILALSPKQEE